MNCDKIIDELLASQKVKVSDNFTDSLFAEIEKEKLADCAIDEFLAAQKASLDSSFTDRLFAKIRYFKLRNYLVKIIPACAVAALCVFSFTTFLHTSNISEFDKLATQMEKVESDLLAMQSYDAMFSCVKIDDFWDYDLTLYN